jgi:hypothetical protein
VAGTDAGTGENYAMKTAASISSGRGRGIAPFPGPHPQKQNQAVYTKLLTHPFIARDLWAHKDLGVLHDSYTVTVPQGGVGHCSGSGNSAWRCASARLQAPASRLGQRNRSTSLPALR